MMKGNQGFFLDICYISYSLILSLPHKSANNLNLDLYILHLYPY